MISVGETLRRGRLKRKLDLGQISNELKITIRLLEAIESEHFEKLPGHVFAKSFVRQYARMVDLDEDDLVAQLQRTLDPSRELPQPSAAPVRPAAELPLPRQKRRQQAGEGAFAWSSRPLVLVAVVTLVCSGVYWWSQRPRSPVAVHQMLAAPQTIQTVQAARPAVPPAAPATPEVGLEQLEASEDRSALSAASASAEKQPPSPRPAIARAAAEPLGNAAVRVQLTAQETVPERNDTQLASTDVQHSGSSSPVRPTSISSSGERSRSDESTDPAERQRLRAFSPPALFVGTNSILPASLDQPPVARESNTDKNELISLLGPPPPPPATDETLQEFETREMKTQTYTGIVLDAVCATHAVTAGSPGPPDDRCDVSPATALFALRLQDGRILQFDSVGNERVRNANRKNKWVATASSGRPIHAKVSGAVLGDKLIVVSIH
jgi:cytoskeleton protein RodZ